MSASPHASWRAGRPRLWASSRLVEGVGSPRTRFTPPVRRWIGRSLGTGLSFGAETRRHACRAADDCSRGRMRRQGYRWLRRARDPLLAPGQGRGGGGRRSSSPARRGRAPGSPASARARSPLNPPRAEGPVRSPLSEEVSLAIPWAFTRPRGCLRTQKGREWRLLREKRNLNIDRVPF